MFSTGDTVRIIEQPYAEDGVFVGDELIYLPNEIERTP
jgi:hypothetical protein